MRGRLDLRCSVAGAGDVSVLSDAHDVSDRLPRPASIVFEGGVLDQVA